MPTTAAIPRSDGRARPWRSAGILLVDAALLWPAVSGGAHTGWPLAVTQLLILAALFLWLSGMAESGRFAWRRTALDLPVGLFTVLILLQLALGNGPLRHWALAAPADGPAALPGRLFLLGTVSPYQTARSLLLFLSYVGVYVLVVNLIQRRHELDRLVSVLLLAGAVLAFLSIVDFLLREAWLFNWRPGPFGSRLTGPFVNPDHWATWMVMLICLGLGHLAGRRGSRQHRGSRTLSTPARRREDTLRQYLPLFGLTLMALATVLTLSRGALLAVLAAGLMLLAGLARVRSRLWVLGLSAVLAAMTLTYALWIGVAPLLARLAHSEHVGRLEQWRSSLPMILSFPALGVGLGAYKDIYFRFQPALLLPGRVYFPYAHSDLLQLVVETGVAGAAVALWAAIRVVRDLVGAHLLGRGRCPVTTEARVRRSDPFSVGIMLGALGAVVAICAHSAVDFSARIPADGVLAAACLGIATVAAHTRFGESGAHSLAETREIAPGPRWRPRAIAGAAIALLGVLFVPLITSQARAVAPAMAEPERRMAAARHVWATLASPGDARAAEARALAGAAADELRRRIASTPTDPYLHERLAWALDLQAVVEPARAAEYRRAALAHMQRAVTLQPENPLLRRSLSALALSPSPPQLTLAIEAGRAAAERDPSLLGSLADQLGPFALTDAQWAALAPPDPIDRAELARHLETRGFLREAAGLYEQAASDALAGDEPVIRWLLARLLLRLRQPEKALEQIDDALADLPGNPELHLTRALAMAALRSPVEALEAHHAAVASAEGRRGAVFPTESPRLRAAISAELGAESRVSVTRYRRALAQRLTDERQWAAAREEWERARTEAPLDAQGEFSRGLALEATGDPQQAAEAFRQAVKLAPARTAFRARLAARLWEAERYVQAIAEWQTIAGQDPANVDVALALGRAYLRTGDRARALAEYRRALALAPGSTEAKQSVARLEGKP